MKSTLRRALWGTALLFGLVGAVHAATAAAPRNEIIVVPIQGTVDEGMAHLVQRAVAQANDDRAEGVVLDINTPGGLVDSAWQIRDALWSAHEPTVAFIEHDAFSAGALIALSAQKVEMTPGSTYGAAEPIPGAGLEQHEAKYVAALRSDFKAAAERNHRDPTLAEAMVDKNVDAPEYKKHGAILSLSANDALRAKMADAIVPDLNAAEKAAGLAPGDNVYVKYTWAEELVRFATSPEVSGLLLSLGMLGLLIEMQTLHGIAGFIGVAALALFFGTHVYAGFSNGLVIGLAVLGLVGILLELHVIPGHGVTGILGAIALLSAVILAFGIPFFFIAVQALSMALIVTVAVFWFASRLFPENAFMRRISFTGVQGPEYVAARDQSALLGRSGVAASYLRPAGVATVDGQRVDVLTEGEFVTAGTPIRITRVEGARVFVQPAKE